MNLSAATAIGTVNGWEGHFRPVWAATFRKVRIKGETVYFKTPEAAECAAWRVLYSLEQRVMIRDGVVLKAISDADAHFNLKPIRRNGKVIEVSRKESA